jgi:FkbM family methyltransferase
MKIGRKIFRLIAKSYKKEYGKYTILNKLFFPYFATKSNEKEILFVNNRFKMTLDSSEYIQGHLYAFDCFEPSTIHLIEKITEKGDNIFDIGANIGYLSLIFARATGNNGKVLSFEPEEKNFNDLVENITLNNWTNIEPIKLAISNNKSQLKLFKSKDNNKGSHSTIFNPDILDEDYELVETITIDEFIEIKSITKIDIIKIDVEGAEYEVLDGMNRILSEIKPIIIMEINDPIQEKRNISSRDLKEKIINYGYHCFNLTEDSQLVQSPLDYKHNIDNVVFIPFGKEPRISKLLAKKTTLK